MGLKAVEGFELVREQIAMLANGGAGSEVVEQVSVSERQAVRRAAVIPDSPPAREPEPHTAHSEHN